jgi:hypothetical protein
MTFFGEPIFEVSHVFRVFCGSPFRIIGIAKKAQLIAVNPSPRPISKRTRDYDCDR